MTELKLRGQLAVYIICRRTKFECKVHHSSLDSAYGRLLFKYRYGTYGVVLFVRYRRVTRVLKPWINNIVYALAQFIAIFSITIQLMEI